MVSKVLFSVLQQQSLDEENLHTILCEVEAILNDHPMTKVSDDVNDLEALTPNRILLLNGKPILAQHFFKKTIFISGHGSTCRYCRNDKCGKTLKK